MLLIFDEAQTAFGRIGHRTGSDYFGVVPDIMSVSKTLGGGLPLAATITTPEIEESVHRKGFNFYTSHVSDPLPAEVGLAVLRVIAEEHLIERARTVGGYLRQRLEELQQRYEAIGDVRGEGLLLGVELVQDRESRKPHHELGRLTTAEVLRYGPEYEYTPPAGAGFGVAHRPAVDRVNQRNRPGGHDPGPGLAGEPRRVGDGPDGVTCASRTAERAPTNGRKDADADPGQRRGFHSPLGAPRRALLQCATESPRVSVTRTLGLKDRNR